jgi:CBS domain-containing protein
MTTGAVAVRAGTPYREMTAMFRKHRVSGFPVVDDDGKVIGVVSETDLLAVEAAEPNPGAQPAPRGWRPHRKVLTVGEATAGALMTHPAVTVGPDETVRNAARLLHSLKLQRLPVVDRDGHLAGIISRSDVLSVFRRTDEEIRREVTQDVIADGFFTDPARFTVTVHDGIVTLEGAPGSAVLGASIVDQVRDLEGVVAVRDRFFYPGSARSSLRPAPDAPDQGPGISGRNAPCRLSRRTIMMSVGERRTQDNPGASRSAKEDEQWHRSPSWPPRTVLRNHFGRSTGPPGRPRSAAPPCGSSPPRRCCPGWPLAWTRARNTPT